MYLVHLVIAVIILSLHQYLTNSILKHALPLINSLKQNLILDIVVIVVEPHQHHRSPLSKPNLQH